MSATSLESSAECIGIYRVADYPHQYYPPGCLSCSRAELEEYQAVIDQLFVVISQAIIAVVSVDGHWQSPADSDHYRGFIARLINSQIESIVVELRNGSGMNEIEVMLILEAARIFNLPLNQLLSSTQINSSWVKIAAPYNPADG